MIRNNEIVDNIINMISNSFDFNQIQIISNAMYLVLNDYSFAKKTQELVPKYNDEKTKAMQMFFVSKKVEGCTDKTLAYYNYVLKNFFTIIPHELTEISADTIRFYIAHRAMNDEISKCTQDNELRCLKSFFNWCSAEGYIGKSPTLNLKPIKQEKRIKQAFTEIELEKIRQAAKTKRDKAMIEVLYSTGVRCAELIGMNKSDIEGDEVVVFGKGEKERIVYLNAKAKIVLEQYLIERTDNNPALFVSSVSPHNRMSTSAIESTIRRIGKDAGVKNCHPHRFRRTCATIALNRGMPLDQVSQMLGHSKIETTTIYARSNRSNVKSSHQKYVV